MMSDPIKKFSNFKISTLENRTNIEWVDAPIQKNVYTEKSLQTSREYGSKEQSQEIRMPYHHPNPKIHYGQR